MTSFHTERWQHIERFTGAPKPVNKYVRRAHCDVAHVCSLEGKLIKTQCVGSRAESCAVEKERRTEPKTDSLSRIGLNKRRPLVIVLC